MCVDKMENKHQSLETIASGKEFRVVPIWGQIVPFWGKFSRPLAGAESTMTKPWMHTEILSMVACLANGGQFPQKAVAGTTSRDPANFRMNDCINVFLCSRLLWKTNMNEACTGDRYTRPLVHTTRVHTQAHTQTQ